MKRSMSIVVNEYATRTTIPSHGGARRLGNTFICSTTTSSRTPTYVEGFYYAAHSRALRTNGACVCPATASFRSTRQRLLSCSAMSTSIKTFRAFPNTREEYDLPTTADKLWEELYVDHIAELDMVARVPSNGLSSTLTSCAN